MQQQDIPPAPGRGQAPQATQVSHATQTSQPVEGASSAQDGGPPGGAAPFGGVGMILIMIVPMVLLMIWMNRSQNKKQREFESKLKKGDRIVTSNGFIDRVVEISPTSKYAKLEITSGMKVEMLKTAIQGLDTGDVAAVSDKNLSDKSDKDKSDKNKK